MIGKRRPIDKFVQRMVKQQAARSDSIKILSTSTSGVSSGSAIKQTDKNGNKCFRFDVSEVDGQDIVE